MLGLRAGTVELMATVASAVFLTVSRLVLAENVSTREAATMFQSPLRPSSRDRSDARRRRGRWNPLFESLERRALLATIIDLGSQASDLAPLASANNSGESVGSISANGGTYAALYTQTTGPINLGALPGDVGSEAYGINDSGVVVGESFNDIPSGLGPYGTDHAFVWVPTTPNGTVGSMIALPAPDAPYDLSCGADAINDLGQIVGWAGQEGDWGGEYAFLWSPATPGGTTYSITKLGSPPGEGVVEPSGINDLGQIVGSYNIEIPVRPSSFYSPGGGWVDLDSLLPANSGWSELTPLGINDEQQIAGWGSYNGVESAFLLDLAPFIVPTRLEWDTTAGGVDYGYQIGGGDLSQATTIELDWASGTTVDTIIGNPIVSTTTETAVGTYSLHATPAQLGAPPPGATDLLAVVDPNNLVSPAAPSKVAALTLPNIAVTSLNWHPDQESTWVSDPVDAGGVDFDYTISGSDLPQPVPVYIYWANGKTLGSELGSPITENDDGTPIMTETAQGGYQLHISAARLSTPPPGSTNLLVVADPPTEQDPFGLIP